MSTLQDTAGNLAAGLSNMSPTDLAEVGSLAKNSVPILSDVYEKFKNTDPGPEFGALKKEVGDFVKAGGGGDSNNMASKFQDLGHSTIDKVAKVADPIAKDGAKLALKTAAKNPTAAVNLANTVLPGSGVGLGLVLKVYNSNIPFVKPVMEAAAAHAAGTHVKTMQNNAKDTVSQLANSNTVGQYQRPKII